MLNPDVMILNKNIKLNSIRDLYKYVLNIKLSKDIEYKTYYSKQDEEAVEEKWKELELNDKTVFLSPYAYSLNWKVLSRDFWYKLAQKLADRGYTAVFNTEKNDFKGFKNLFLPINQTGIFTKKCYASIMFRSGLTDIVAVQNVNKLFVLYPKLMEHPLLGLEQRNVWVKNFVYDENLPIEKNLFNIMSLKSIVNKYGADEIIFDGDEEKLINYFLEKL